MGFSVLRRDDGAWKPASFIAHAWSILWRKDAGRLFREKRRLGVLRKTRAVCSSMGGLQGGDDEAAESGTEMVVRLGVLRGWGMVAEMLAVVRITLFPLGTQGRVFEDD